MSYNPNSNTPPHPTMFISPYEYQKAMSDWENRCRYEQAKWNPNDSLESKYLQEERRRAVDKAMGAHYSPPFPTNTAIQTNRSNILLVIYDETNSV